MNFRPINRETIEKIRDAFDAKDIDLALSIIQRHPEITQVEEAQFWFVSAAKNGLIEVMEYLLPYVDIDKTDAYMQVSNALSGAIRGNDIHTVKWLISHGADVKVCVEDDCPIFSAVHTGNLELVKLVCEAGASVAVKKKGGNFYPLDLAKHLGYLDVQAYLEDKMRLEKSTKIKISPFFQFLKEKYGKVVELNAVAPIRLRGIKLYHIPPSIDDPTHTLITEGLSNKPMTVPAGKEKYRYAELKIHLPENWPMSKQALLDEKNFWPIRWLVNIAHYPIENNTWLGDDFTLFANGDPPEPLALGVEFTTLLLSASSSDENVFKMEDGKLVNILTVFPIYSEERALEMAEGVHALLSRFVENEVPMYVDVGRKNYGVE